MKVIKVVLIPIALSLFFSCYNKYNMQDNYISGYMRGQRDALEGNIRIEKLSNGCYVFVKAIYDTDIPLKRECGFDKKGKK